MEPARDQLWSPLSHLIAKGIGWIALTRVLLQVATIARIIVIARLLGPEDFGLFGIAILALTMVETLSRTGFDAALVQRRGDISSYLDTVWTIQAIRGAILAAFVFLTAPMISGFFSEPRSEDLLKAIAFAPLISGFKNVAVVELQRDLAFDRRAVLDIGITMSDLVTSIVLVLVLRTVAALVIGSLVGAAVGVVLSYVVVPRRPRISMNANRVKALHSFAGWTWIETVAKTVTHDGDDILVGRMLGADILGLYRMAYRLSNIVTTQITDALSLVMFPVHSKLAQTPGGSRHVFLKTFQFVALISVPLTVLLISVAADFTKFALGSNWLPMVPTLQLLAVWGLDRSLIATVAPVIQGNGHAKSLAKINLLRLLVLGILVYPLTLQWKTEGTAFAVVLAGLISDTYGFHKGFSLMKCGLAEAVHALIPAALSGLIMTVIAFGLSVVLSGDSWQRFLTIVVMSSLTYISACCVIDQWLKFHLFSDAVDFLGRLAGSRHRMRQEEA